MHAPIYIAILIVMEITLGIAPKADRLTWTLENIPVWIGVGWIALTYKRFPLSQLLLALLTIHSIILAVGGFASAVCCSDGARRTSGSAK